MTSEVAPSVLADELNALEARVEALEGKMTEHIVTEGVELDDDEDPYYVEFCGSVMSVEADLREVVFVEQMCDGLVRVCGNSFIEDTHQSPSEVDKEWYWNTREIHDGDDVYDINTVEEAEQARDEILGEDDDTSTTIEPPSMTLTLSDEARESIQTSVGILKSDLDDVSGVGYQKQKALYEAGYESKEDLRRASQSELADIDGIGNALAARIKADVGSVETKTIEDYDCKKRGTIGGITVWKDTADDYWLEQDSKSGDSHYVLIQQCGSIEPLHDAIAEAVNQ